MRVMLLAAAGSLAALAAGTGPVQAQQFTDGFSGSHHGGSHGRLVDSRRGRDFSCDLRDRRDREGDIRVRRHRDHDGDGRRDRRDRRRDRDCFGGDLGYLDYGDYDANRSFDPDLWNDWWHERPWRAYPRWVQNNQGCTPDRMWYSGSGWRCSW